MTAPDVPSAGAAPAPGRRRLWRALVYGFLGALALVALAPAGLGPLLRGRVEAQLAERLGAATRLQRLGFAWPARVHASGLAVSDANGAPLFSLDSVDARLGLAALLGGRIEAELELAYPELHVSRASDGRLNLASVIETVAAAGSPEEDEEPSSEELPEVKARVRVRDGHVVLHGPGGETTLGEILLDLDVESLARPAPFRLALKARGPSGPAGALSLEGSFTAAPEGRIEPESMAGTLDLALDELDLAGFAPSLGLLAPLEGLAGILGGRVALRLAPGLALTGTSDVELRGLELRAPRTKELARIERIVLRGEATQQGEGKGTQRLELGAGPWLALRYEGRSDLVPVGPGALAGALTLGVELGPLAELARGWLPLQEGVLVAGRLEHRLELEATLADRRPERARVVASGGISDLSARDARGALDLGELTRLALELEATADWKAGTLSLAKLVVDAGPVTCSGQALATGLAPDGSAAALALGSGSFRLEADLERLRGNLAPLLELPPEAFGGRVKADVDLTAEDDGLALAAALEGRALSLAGSSLATLDGELRARRGADGALSGSGTLRLGTLRVERPGEEPLALAGLRATLSLAEDAALRGEHALALESVDRAFALALDVQSQRAPDALALASTFRLDGDLARLAELAAPFAALRPGVAGALRLEGTARLEEEAGALATLEGDVTLAVADLSVPDATGSPRALQALARTTLGAGGRYDARRGQAELTRLALSAGGLDVSGSARVRGLAAGPKASASPELEDGRLRIEADLARLGAELGELVDLGGWSLAGSPLVAEVALSTEARRILASGSLTADELRLGRPEAAPLTLAELGLDFDLGYDHELGSLHVRKSALRSRTASLSLAGTLNELADPARARGAMKLELQGSLARILGDLGLETEGSGRRTQGALSASLALEGDRGSFRLTGKGALADFRLELAPAREGEAPLLVEEPRIELDTAARITLPALDVELERLTVTSGLVRGGAQGRILNLHALGAEPGGEPDEGQVRFERLAGELAYVPDRLGPVLAPWLPGKLSGAEEQRVTFTLDGAVRDLDVAALLAGTTGRVDLGLGLLERPEIQLAGLVVLENHPGELELRGNLQANGGTLQLDGLLDLAEGKAKPRSRLKVTARELRANAGLAPVLALVHPAFASAQLAQGGLDGILALDLDLTYDGPLTLEGLQAGWEALPKTPIHGSGRLELNSAALRGSPLLAMLSELGVDATKTLDVRPIEFTIQKGRVSYAKPWTWTLSGTETTFTGTIGLDQSLDLAWNLPITERLVERWSFLASLRGETLSVPLRGTALKPRLESEALLKDLAAKAAKSELESRLGLGGGKGGEDPESLLERADALWKEGKKAEAAALYLRLREDFKLSLTYALNKDRIRDRSKYKDPPR